jgi:hypothetical protein
VALLVELLVPLPLAVAELVMFTLVLTLTVL